MESNEPQWKRQKLDPANISASTATTVTETQWDGDFVIADDSFKRSHPVYTLVHGEKEELSPFYKWSPTDDLLLKNAVERYLLPEEIIAQIKFNAKFSTFEIIERWKALLYDAVIAERAAKGMQIVQQTMNKQLPWSEEETNVIRDELKQKGFASAYCVLERQREKFHPTRTVKSLEAQFYKWKRSGGEWDQISSLQSPKLRGDLIEPLVEQEILDDTEKMIVEESDIKEAKTMEKRNAKLAVKLEKEQSFNTKRKKVPSKKKKKPTVAVDVPPVTGETSSLASDNATGALEPPTPVPSTAPPAPDIPEYIFAYFEGTKCKIPIRKEISIIGRQNKNEPVDIDVSLEGSAPKVSRKQAILTILPIRTSKTLVTVAGLSTLTPDTMNTGTHAPPVSPPPSTLTPTPTPPPSTSEHNEQVTKELKQHPEEPNDQVPQAETPQRIAPLVPAATTQPIAEEEEEQQKSNTVLTVSKKYGAVTAVFQIKNVGKREIFVNQERVAPEAETILTHANLIKFPGDLSFTFVVQEDQVDKWLVWHQAKHSQQPSTLSSSAKKKKKKNIK